MLRKAIVESELFPVPLPRVRSWDEVLVAHTFGGWLWG